MKPRATVPYNFMNKDGEIYIANVPAVRVVCPRCQGVGSHDPEGFSDGFTSSEFDDCFGDEEGRAAYFAGRYDVRCEECHGNRVIDIPNIEEMTPEQLEDLERLEDAEYRIRQEAEDERRWMC